MSSGHDCGVLLLQSIPVSDVSSVDMDVLVDLDEPFDELLLYVGAAGEQMERS